MPTKLNCDFCNNSLDDRFNYLTCSFKPAAITPSDEELMDYMKALSNNFEAIYCNYECLWAELDELSKEAKWVPKKKATLLVEKNSAKRPKK